MYSEANPCANIFGYYSSVPICFVMLSTGLCERNEASQGILPCVRMPNWDTTDLTVVYQFEKIAVSLSLSKAINNPVSTSLSADRQAQPDKSFYMRARFSNCTTTDLTH